LQTILSIEFSKRWRKSLKLLGDKQKQPRIRLMAISSVSSNVPSPPPAASVATAQQTPPPKNDGDNDDNSVQQTRAPLPPGQGTRVDQLA
jgi:hypothetical protein